MKRPSAYMQPILNKAGIMSGQHAHQVKDWNGQSGERWVVHQSWLDQMLDAFGLAAIGAADPAPGETILDIGCGAGTTTRALAERIGDGGHVTGIDISEPLITRAKQGAAADEPIDFLLADASAENFPPASFDLLYSRFGVMFFDDPAAAFRQLRKALKPGGRLAFICWRRADENDWVRVPLGAIREIVPPSAPIAPDAPGPFAFGDKARVQAIIEDAGFTDVAFTPFDHEIIFGRGYTQEAAIDDAVHMAFEIGPLSRALADTNDEVRAQASAAVRAAFAMKATDQQVIINGAAWIVTASNGAQG